MQKSRMIQPEDLLTIKSLSEPQISLDGQYVAVVETTIDAVEDTYRDVIHVFQTDSERKAMLCSTSHRLRSPRFSPDGVSLAWIETDRDGRDLIYVNVLASIFVDEVSPSEASCIYRSVQVQGGIEWSPQGDLYAMEVTTSPSEIKIYEDLHYKTDGLGLTQHKQSSILHLRIDEGTVEKLWSGMGEAMDLTVSKEGSKLAFTLPQSPNREFYINDIYLYDRDARACRLLRKGRGPVSALRFSPDGTHLAFVGHEGERWNDITQTLYVTDIETGATNQAAPDFDRPTAPYGTGDIRPTSTDPHIEYGEDGHTVWFLASDRGRSSIYQLNIDDRPTELVSQGAAPVEVIPASDRCVSYFVTDRAGDLVYLAGSPTRPDTMFLYRNGLETILYDSNRDFFADLSLSRPQLLTNGNNSNPQLDRWLMMPTGPKPASGYPLVLVIHGGPHNAYGYGFQMEFQTLCTAGFAVLYVNPRGSQTYGQAFASAVVNDWGDEDFQDLMKAVDAAIATGQIDSTSMGVTGYSYGGYMTNWTISHTDRFRAAATGGCVANLVSMAGTSDIGPIFIPNEHGESVWDDPELLWNRSPLAHVAKVNTPCLVYHSEGDDRCPIGQSEEFFTALRGLGKDAVFVRYPGGSHLFATQGKPSYRVDKLTRVTNWFVTKIKS